jgi:hypothetical protein
MRVSLRRGYLLLSNWQKFFGSFFRKRIDINSFFLEKGHCRCRADRVFMSANPPGAGGGVDPRLGP